MESLSECIRRATASSRPPPSSRRASPPLVRDFMVRPVVTLSPNDSLLGAMDIMIRRRISGAPVTDGVARVLGVISEFDCMRVVAESSFHHEPDVSSLRVVDVMSPLRSSVTPEMDLFAVVHRLLDAGIRRLPVLELDRLVGIVSRRDVLRVIRQHYG